MSVAWRSGNIIHWMNEVTLYWCYWNGNRQLLLSVVHSTRWFSEITLLKEFHSLSYYRRWSHVCFRVQLIVKIPRADFRRRHVPWRRWKPSNQRVMDPPRGGSPCHRGRCVQLPWGRSSQLMDWRGYAFGGKRQGQRCQQLESVSRWSRHLIWWADIDTDAIPTPVDGCNGRRGGGAGGHSGLLAGGRKVTEDEEVLVMRTYWYFQQNRVPSLYTLQPPCYITPGIWGGENRQ